MSTNSPLQINTPESILDLLAERLRLARLQLGWKQETLAERSGVSVATLRRFERDGRTSFENLLKLCHALGRLDGFEDLLQPPPAQSLDELEQRVNDPPRRRGNR